MSFSLRVCTWGLAYEVSNANCPGSSILENCLKRARPSVTRRIGPVVRPSIDENHMGTKGGDFKASARDGARPAPAKVRHGMTNFRGRLARSPQAGRIEGGDCPPPRLPLSHRNDRPRSERTDGRRRAVLGAPPRLLAPAHARRRAADGHARHLPLLAHHRRAPLPVGQYRDRRRNAGICRHAARAADRLPGGDRHSDPGLCRLLRGGARSRADRASVGRRRLRGAVRARAICHLPGAPLPAHPHHLSRLALPPGGLGLGLRAARHRLVDRDRAHARARLSVPARQPRTLQDAQHLLRRPRRPFRRLRLRPVLARTADVAAGGGAAGAGGRRLRRGGGLDRRSPTRSARAATT